MRSRGCLAGNTRSLPRHLLKHGCKVARVLLDFMRRELAIKVTYLDPEGQESLRQLSNQRLIAPWAMDENEILEHSAILFPRRKLGDQEEYGGNLYLSPRGGFGQYLTTEYHLSGISRTSLLG